MASEKTEKHVLLHAHFNMHFTHVIFRGIHIHLRQKTQQKLHFLKGLLDAHFSQADTIL